MKYLSVCSGIEAATVAWHGLGWEPVAFAEIEAFPAAVLSQHYPTVPNLGDLTKYREWPEELLVEVELLVGGTPCQAFSVAGQRRSLDDERGNLSLVYVNLYHHINEVRKRHGRPPAIALWENVPGVLSTKDNAFGCFIGGLLGCDEAPATESGKWDKAGFLSSETVRVGYRVLDAQYFGVAQRRRRVFLAAVPCELVERFGERACPSEILSLRESVLGNPPTRGAAWEGTSRTTAAGLTSSGRGVERPGESRGQDDVVIDCRSVAGTLNGNGKAAGSATQQDAETGMLVAFGGNRSSGPLDVSTSCLANGSPHGRQDFASETFVACFHPTQDPISSTDGSAHAMGTGSKGGCSRHAVCVTGHRTHALTTRAAACEEDGTGRGTPITPAIAFTAEDSGGDATNEVSPTMRAMHHINENANAGGQLAVAFSDSAAAHSYGVAQTVEHTPPLRGWHGGNVIPAVAFKPGQSEAAGGTFVTEEFTPAQNNGSTAVPAVAFTKAKRAQSITDDESWVPGSVAPTQNQFDQGDTRATTVVCAIQERAICENPSAGPDGAGVRDDGVAYTLEARTVCQAVAFANRTRDGIKVPEVMKDGVVPALTNPGGGGRSDAVNVVAPGPVQVQWASGGGQVENPTMQSLRSNAEYNYQFIRNAMQVRRLTPTECAYLQGFPADYIDITFRKKPAADGPKYRALGNSMAVPCMWWLGYRIQQATQ